MPWSVFGDRKWQSSPDASVDKVRSIFGDVEFEVSAAPPGEARTVKAFSLIGDLKVVVPKGSRVSTGGFSLIGDTRVDVTPGEGPTIIVKATHIIGDTKIVEAPA